MIWRGKNKYLNHSNNAISSVISTVIILAIIIGTTTTIFSIGFTELKNINDKKNENIIESNINYLSESILKITSSIYSEKTILNNLKLEGKINIDNEELDTIIVFYSLNYSYDFSVTIIDIDYGDKSELKINQTNNPIANKIKIFIIRDGKLIEDKILSLDDEYKIILPKEFLNNNLFFELYTDNELLGRIWLFSTPSLVFSDSNSNYDVILNAVGILCPSSTVNNIKKQTLMDVNNKSLFFRIFHLNNDNSLLFNLNDFETIHLEKQMSKNFGPEKAYFLKLQIHNDYSQEWTNYFEQIFNKDNTLFYKELDGTLVYIPSTTGEIWLSLLYSYIRFEYK